MLISTDKFIKSSISMSLFCSSDYNDTSNNYVNIWCKKARSSMVFNLCVWNTCKLYFRTGSSAIIKPHSLLTCACILLVFTVFNLSNSNLFYIKKTTSLMMIRIKSTAVLPVTLTLALPHVRFLLSCGRFYCYCCW